MGNAVPELQALADQITTDNNHNGVGEAIAKWQ
ncbi:HAD hydrolase family protein [Limosilactobacillus mucosae]|nr:HAD hydrolase family protein [Limosilactobacillus mucosae]